MNSYYRQKRYWVVLALVVLGVAGITYHGFDHGGAVQAKSEAKAKTVKHSSTVKTQLNIPPIDAHDQQTKEIDQEIKQTDYSGTALVFKNGKPIFHQAYGYADQVNQRKNSTDGLFGIASVAKNMTAMLVMREIQEGRLSLNQHIKVFYPQLPNADQITILQLLNMSSGYKQTNTSTDTMSAMDYVNYNIGHIEDPGYKTWSYKAVNYSVLDGILQKVTGKTYPQLFDEYFHAQKNYAFYDYDAFLKSDQHTQSYDAADGHQFGNNPVIFNREVGTGNIALTDSTFYQYFRDELAGKLVSQTCLEKMMQPADNSDYSGGMYAQRFANRYYLHGMILGFEPTIYSSTDGKNMVILLSNHNTDNVNAPKPHANINLGETIYQQITN
ncbi:MAG: beta-lactamase family protein [Lactobacillaceae bacterium]|jgi:hypothetical protein|nr:beta-lactamase family protein [Lactobacillaceae bacterium]